MRVLKLTPENLELLAEDLSQALRNGKIAICPTDTVYGLVAKAEDRKAITGVFTIKKRPYSKPLPVFVKDLRTARNLAFISQKQRSFLKKFWPGKMTAILKAKSNTFPPGLISQEGKIGLRIPNYELLNLLLKEVDFPLTGTSANVSGGGSLIKINEVLKQFKKEDNSPDLIIDAGDLLPSLPSTVVDLVNFKVLRLGAVPKEKIMRTWQS